MKAGLAGLALAVGCSGSVQSVSGEAVETVFPSCVPTSGRLGSEATLAAHAGSYRLTLVRPGDPVASVRGNLVLYPQVAGFESLGKASTPLYGTADVRLGSVGALRVGDTESDAAEAPGVLVLEFDRAGARNILLRLGSAANRRDRMLYDGAYTVLEVKEISVEGFSGSWRSGSDATPVGGHFCASQSLRQPDAVWNPAGAGSRAWRSAVGLYMP
ncbi:MAG: hypothetical protein OXP28_04500 [Gammaproteobacteria bacterium]|nr:hypothetical protein [Gammaproteobacteria bacterium]